jgi:hypothetical protein
MINPNAMDDRPIALDGSLRADQLLATGHALEELN